MTKVLLGVVLLASLLAPAAAARPTVNPSASYSYRILNKPTSSDERAIKTLGLQPEAQRRSDRLFGGLQSLLGGVAPKLNYVVTGSPLAPDNMSTNLTDRPGAPIGTINVDPLAIESLINNKSPYHDQGVNQYPHEMMHARQTQQTLAQLLTREGGAQAFADLVTPVAAKRAGIPYNAENGNVDGSYAEYVQAVQQPPYGRDWILGGQMGKTAPVNWP